jgi:hypothetical protein
MVQNDAPEQKKTAKPISEHIGRWSQKDILNKSACINSENYKYEYKYNARLVPRYA